MKAVGKLRVLVLAMLQKKKPASACFYNKQSKWVQTKKMYIPRDIS